MSLLEGVTRDLHNTSLPDGPECHECRKPVRPSHRDVLADTGLVHYRCFVFGRVMGRPLTKRKG